MKITKMHYEFWCAKRCKVSWYTPPTGKYACKVTVDDLIPESKAERNLRLSTHNTLAVLRMARNNGQLMQRLEEMADCGTTVLEQRRQINCAKWLARIKKERNKMLQAKY